MAKRTAIFADRLTNGTYEISVNGKVTALATRAEANKFVDITMRAAQEKRSLITYNPPLSFRPVRGDSAWL